MQRVISTHFSDKERPYTGVELRPHFLLTELGLQGSAIGAFIGGCRVATEHLVDWEDRLAQDHIEAARMVHFIGEFFGVPSLREGVLLQRLIMSILGDEVRGALPVGCAIRREGDDLYVATPSGGERKLSVSIVTASPVSLLLHIGINIDPAGAPVPAIGLQELGVDPAAWTGSVLDRISNELQGVEWACAKVRPVLGE